jgi:hypothetical protein
MSDSPQAILHMLFRQWEEVALETARCLANESASLFVNLYLDALDIPAPFDFRPCPKSIGRVAIRPRAD